MIHGMVLQFLPNGFWLATCLCGWCCEGPPTRRPDAADAWRVHYAEALEVEGPDLPPDRDPEQT